ARPATRYVRRMTVRGSASARSRRASPANAASGTWALDIHTEGKPMFETLTAAPPDKILNLSVLYRNDSRPEKMDLGVGVYKDSSGATVIMKAVREAEKRLHDSQTTKTYVGMGGDDGFNKAMLKLVF